MIGCANVFLDYRGANKAVEKVSRFLVVPEHLSSLRFNFFCNLASPGKGQHYISDLFWMKWLANRQPLQVVI